MRRRGRRRLPASPRPADRSSTGVVEGMSPARGDDQEEPGVVRPDELLGRGSGIHNPEPLPSPPRRRGRGRPRRRRRGPSGLPRGARPVRPGRRLRRASCRRCRPDNDAQRSTLAIGDPEAGGRRPAGVGNRRGRVTVQRRSPSRLERQEPVACGGHDVEPVRREGGILVVAQEPLGAVGTDDPRPLLGEDEQAPRGREAEEGRLGVLLSGDTVADPAADRAAGGREVRRRGSPRCRDGDEQT